MIEFAKIYGEWNNYYGNHTYQKLTNAACYYGYNFDELAHDSLEDVKATLVVYNAIKKPPYVWMSMQYVPEIKMKELPQIILETVASLNKMNKKQERLIEITADGIIDNDELDDFIYIQEELEKISVNVETLQLWSERMLASGAIDEDAYNKRKLQKSNY